MSTRACARFNYTYARMLIFYIFTFDRHADRLYAGVSVGFIPVGRTSNSRQTAPRRTRQGTAQGQRSNDVGRNVGTDRSAAQPLRQSCGFTPSAERPRDCIVSVRDLTIRLAGWRVVA